MLGRLRSYSRDGRWVPLKLIGSRGAMCHLVDKGYAERKTETGPRGGRHESYRPRLAACAELDRSKRPNPLDSPPCAGDRYISRDTF